MKHPVVWFEVTGKNGEALQSFYGELFDWKLKQHGGTPGEYAMFEVADGDKGIGGGVGQAGNGFPEGARFYVGTSDLAASVKRAKDLGGKELMPPTDLPDGPSIALISDPEGRVVGLVKQ